MERANKGIIYVKKHNISIKFIIMKEEIIELRKITADSGKVFQNIATGETHGNTIYLGDIDSPDNYIEIDVPETEENND